MEITFAHGGGADSLVVGAAVSALSGIARGEPVREPHADGRRTVLRVPVADVEGLVPVVVRALDAAGVPYSDVAARQSTLDDVFFALTGHAADASDAADALDTAGAAGADGADDVGAGLAGTKGARR